MQSPVGTGDHTERFSARLAETHVGQDPPFGQPCVGLSSRTPRVLLWVGNRLGQVRGWDLDSVSPAAAEGRKGVGRKDIGEEETACDNSLDSGRMNQGRWLQGLVFGPLAGGVLSFRGEMLTARSTGSRAVTVGGGTGGSWLCGMKPRGLGWHGVHLGGDSCKGRRDQECKRAEGNKQRARERTRM